MDRAPLDISPRTAARLLAGHIHDTTTVGAVVWHIRRSPSAAVASAALILVVAAFVVVAAAL